MALASLAASAAHADDIPIVAAIKATYLTKFAPFVDWPANNRAATDPVVLCILNDDQIAGLIEHADNPVPSGGRPTVIRRLASVERAATCQILFIGGSASGAVGTTALAAVSAAPTLTVTSDAAEGRKGIINFVIRDDRVRFEIDDAEAARHGLQISSKLLSLAVSVKPRS